MKKKHILIVENYVLFGALLRTIAQETASQIALRNCSKEVREKPGYIGVFTGKNKKVKKTQKIKHVVEH